MIDGVRIKRLTMIPDERGRLMEILRRDDDLFERFGQAYITTAYPGVVKAWHYHKRQTDYMAPIVGMFKVVLYDARETSPTHGAIEEIFAGEYAPALIVVPPNVYHGFKNIGQEEGIVLNLPTEPYNADHPDEFRLPPDSLPDGRRYNWARVNR